jgi:hypothetical protein
MQSNIEQIVELFEVEEIEQRLENNWVVCRPGRCFDLD